MLESLFKPKSIAVIGASRTKGTIGRDVLHNLLEYEFNGKVFPVNPSAQVIHSIKCFKSVLDIPDQIDLAIIIVRKELVLKVVQECGQKGVKGLVIISAGFKEVGDKGIKREQEVLAVTRKYGMRMIGPNCMGIINTESGVKMDATFAPIYPLKGSVGFISQSGALGVAILEYARRIGLGFSVFASVGNMADVSTREILEYCQRDPQTKNILLYLEKFSEPREFTRIARMISKKKPIIAVKSGRTIAGARAAVSHTGSLAALDIAVDALFEQCGVIRVSSIEELFDLALAFTHQPLPQGNRIAIMTNAGGPGILATDACINSGLQIPKLSGRTKKLIRDKLPEDASAENPIDMLPSAGPDQYESILRILIEDKEIDAVIVIFVPPVVINALEVAHRIARISATSSKPILGCLMGFDIKGSEFETMEKSRIPVYTFPESAVNAISAMTKHAQWVKKPDGTIKEFKIDKNSVTKIIQKAAKENRSYISGSDAKTIISAYGIPVAASQVVTSMEETLSAAEEIGYPIVMKVNTPAIPHKSDVGGVALDIRNEAEAIKAYRKIQESIKKTGMDMKSFSLMIQEMVKGGKDTIMGMSLDPAFGPLMMFGLGGIYVEVMKDVTFRIHPLTDLDAREMVTSIKGYSLLQGVRGDKPVDIDFLVECLQRLSQLVSDFHEIVEFDINPFVACAKGKGSKAVDLRIVISTPKNNGG